MMAVSLQKLFQQTFEDHKGRPGKVGGSVPRGTSSSSYKDREYEYARYILTRKIGDPLPPHIEEFDKDFTWDDDKYPTLGDWARATVDRYSINKTIEDSAGILTKEDRSKLKFISKKIGGFTEPYKVEITKPKKLSELDWNHLGEWGYTPHSLIPSHLQAVGWWDSPSEEKPFWTIYVAETDLAPRDEIFWHEFSHTLSTNVVDEITGGIQEGETSGDRNDRFARFMARGMKHQQQGHFGHKGRKGKVGGSLPGKGSVPDMTPLKEISSVDEATEHGIFGRASFVYKGKVYDSGVHHEQVIHELGFRKGYPGVSDFLVKGGLRVRSVDKKFLYIQGEFSSSNQKSFISDIQEYADSGIFGDVYSYKQVIIENNFLDPSRKVPSLKVETTGLDLMNGEFRFVKNSGTFKQGSSGSGHHGHAGRPGKVGGSLPRTRTEISTLAKRHLKYDRDAYIEKVDRIIDELPLSARLVDVMGELNLDVREDMGSSYAGHFGNTIQVSRGAVEGKFGKTLSESYRYAPTVLHGVIAHEMGHHIQGRLEFEEQVRWNELIENRSLFSEFKKNKLPDINEQFASPLRGNELFAEAFAYYMWDPTLLPDPVLDYMDSIAMDIPVEKNSELFQQRSGHFGHKGRPGKVGGSVPSGTTNFSTYREFSHNRSGDTHSWGKGILDVEDISEEEYLSLNHYKLSSTNYNDYLRGNIHPSSVLNRPERIAQFEQTVKNLDTAIAKSVIPENVIVFRGINKNILGPDTGDYTGVEFQDKGFISTTLHMKSALGWSWTNQDEIGTVIKINLDKGSRALYLDELLDRGEYELLLPRDMKFRVVKDETVDRFGAPDPWRLLTVEVIP